MAGKNFKAIKNIQVGDQVFAQKFHFEDQPNPCDNQFYLLEVTAVERSLDQSQFRLKTLYGWSVWRLAHFRFEVAEPLQPSDRSNAPLQNRFQNVATIGGLSIE